MYRNGWCAVGVSGRTLVVYLPVPGTGGDRKKVELLEQSVPYKYLLPSSVRRSSAGREGWEEEHGINILIITESSDKQHTSCYRWPSVEYRG